MRKSEFGCEVLERAGHHDSAPVLTGVEREIVQDAITGGVNVALFEARTQYAGA